MVACADLIGRSGATSFQIGYLNDDEPHQWYAHAQYRGARITVDDQPDPAAAARGLAERILTGGQCYHCKGLVALHPDGAVAFAGAYLAPTGEPWGLAQAGRARQCLWIRQGRRWVRGCE